MDLSVQPRSGNPTARTAWRIEFPCGAGPYTGDSCARGDDCPYRDRWEHPHCTEMCWDHGDRGHPTPLADGMDVMRDKFGLNCGWTDDHLCGCVNYNALRRWFKGWHKDLHEMGFIARKYEIIPEIPSDFLLGRSGTQVGFRREKARVIAESSLI